MKEKELSVGNKILLWIAVLPVSVIAYLIIYWGNMFLGKLWFDSVLIIDILSTAFANVVTPCIAAIIAPNYKKIVVIIFSLFIIVFTGISAYITIMNPNTDRFVNLIILQVISIISAICPLVYACKHTEEELNFSKK